MKNYFLIIFLSLAMPVLPATARASDSSTVLQPYVAQYELLRAGHVAGEVNVKLEHIGKKQWRMTSHTRGTRGLAALAGVEVVETSEFTASAKGLSCGRYQYRQTGLSKRERSVDCNTSKKEIISRDHRGEYRFPAQSGVLDRQIVSLALGMKLAMSKQTELSLPVVDRERLEPQSFQVGAEELLQIPAGSMRTIKLERAHGSSQRMTTTWLAIDNGWIPARIVHTGADGGIELRLRSLQR